MLAASAIHAAQAATQNQHRPRPSTAAAVQMPSERIAPKTEAEMDGAAPESGALGFPIPQPDQDDEDASATAEVKQKVPEVVKTLWPTGEGEGISFARDWTWKLWEAPESNLVSHYLNIYILAMIVISSVVGVVETVPGLHRKNKVFWFVLESLFVGSFTIEFLCRVWSCPDYKVFWKSGMNYIDVLSILPFYFDLAIGGGTDLSVLRILRLGRAIRLVKLSRYSGGIQLIMSALARSQDALQLFFMLLTLIIIVCASGIYFTERGVWSDEHWYYERTNPLTGVKEKSPFQSIPQSYWWCIVTLTTVGYGDYYPVTYLGQVMGTLTQLIGVVCLALPLSIIGSNFIEERQKMLDLEAEAAREALADGKAGAAKLGFDPSVTNISADNRAKFNQVRAAANFEEEDTQNQRQPQMYAERFQKNVLEICTLNDKILGPASRCLALMHRQIMALDTGEVIKQPYMADLEVSEDELVVVPQVLSYFEEWLNEAEAQADVMASHVGSPEQGLTHRVPSRAFGLNNAKQ